MSITNMNKPAAGSTGWGSNVNANFTDVENFAKGTETAQALQVDNLKLDGNTLSSTDTNGNINVTPDGTGKVVLDGLNWPTADGTNAQVLQTNGSAQLSWADAGGSSDIVKISSATISSDATVDFTSDIDSTYDIYVFEFIDVVPATDDVYLEMRVSTDGGSSWKSGSNDYSYAVIDWNDTWGGDSDCDNSDNSIHLTASNNNYARWGNASAESGFGRVVLQNPSSSSLYTNLYSDFAIRTAASGLLRIISAASFEETGAVDGVRFYFSSGNLSSGTINMWGRK